MQNKDQLNENFPSNSNSIKKEEKKKPEKIIKGSAVQQKKSFGKRLLDIFIEDDTRSVGDYIAHDVLIPAAKALICDIVGWGGFAEMILFGGSKGGSRYTKGRGSGGGTYTNYNNISFRSGNQKPEREISREGRAKQDIGEIVLETRGEAEDVLSHMVDQIADYGEVTIGYLYDLVGIESNYTDDKYGWRDLRSSDVNRVRRGYALNLPRPQLLE